MNSARQSTQFKGAEDTSASGITLGDLSAYLESQGFPCRIDGNPDITIQAVNTLDDADEGVQTRLPATDPPGIDMDKVRAGVITDATTLH